MEFCLIGIMILFLFILLTEAFAYTPDGQLGFRYIKIFLCVVSVVILFGSFISIYLVYLESKPELTMATLTPSPTRKIITATLTPSPTHKIIIATFTPIPARKTIMATFTPIPARKAITTTLAPKAKPVSTPVPLDIIDPAGMVKVSSSLISQIPSWFWIIIFLAAVVNILNDTGTSRKSRRRRR